MFQLIDEASEDVFLFSIPTARYIYDDPEESWASLVTLVRVLLS